MLFQCLHCGAPLDVSPTKAMVTCAYCKSKQRVIKEQAAPTPAGWRPPAQWTPPAHLPARSVPLTFQPNKAIQRSILLISLLTLLPGVIFAASSVANSRGLSLQSLVPGLGWDGRNTFVCSGNDTKRLSGLTVVASAVPAIAVDGNCTLIIEKSTLTGELLLDVRSNGQVEIRDSTLTFVGRRGLRADGNRAVRIIGSRVHVQGRPGDRAEVVALFASGNKRLELERTELRVTPGAAGATVVVAHASGIGNISLRDSSVLIDRAARPERLELLRVDSLGSASVDGGWVDGGGLELRVSGKKATVTGVDLRGAKLSQPGR